MPSQDSKTCSVVMIIEREDMTTDDGYRFAQSAVNRSNKSNMVFISSAISCTGGSPWQNINKLFQEVKKGSRAILGYSKHSGRNSLCLLNGSIIFEEAGESVSNGPRIVLTGIGRRSDHFWQNGIYKKFVSMVVQLVQKLVPGSFSRSHGECAQTIRIFSPHFVA